MLISGKVDLQPAFWYNVFIMRKLTFAVLFFILSLHVQASVVNYAGEKYYLPDNIKSHVDKTFSVSATERAEASFKLGKIGSYADKSIPFLMRLLDDNLPVWCRYNGYGEWTTPGKEAAKALAEIGRPSLKYLLPLLEKNHPYVFMNEFMERNVVFALYKITGQEFGSDFAKWIEWIKKQQINE